MMSATVMRFKTSIFEVGRGSLTGDLTQHFTYIPGYPSQNPNGFIVYSAGDKGWWVVFFTRVTEPKHIQRGVDPRQQSNRSAPSTAYAVVYSAQHRM